MAIENIGNEIQLVKSLLSRLADAKLCGDDSAEIYRLSAGLEFLVELLERELGVEGVA